MTMIIYVLVATFTLSFVSTFLITKWLIPILKAKDIVGFDMNKSPPVKVPEMGGIAVILGFFIGIYAQILIYVQYSEGVELNDFLLVSVISAIGIGLIGILDDLLNLRQSVKAILPFLFALPLGLFVSNIIFLPFLGDVNFGWSVLLLVPFGVTCAANSTNMLEGFNGLGTGMAIIVSFALIIMSILSENVISLFLLIPLLGSLLAFLVFNRYPSKIFPGDSLTLFMGGIIGCSAIISNLKLEGAILLSPMIVEFFLKLKGKFKAECFAEEIQDGVLIFNGDVQSLTHLVMKIFSFNEKQLVLFFWFTESIIAMILILVMYF